MKAMIRLSIFFIGILYIPIYWVFSIFPKRRNLWLFSAWQGLRYSDNSRYLYEHVRNKKSIQAYWLTKSRAHALQLNHSGVNAVYSYSLRGILLQASAGVIFFTHSANDEFVTWALSLRTKRVQLWHGIPLKKVGISNKAKKWRVMKLIRRLIFKPYRLDQIDLMIAAGLYDKNIYIKDFGLSDNIVRVTGLPRTDVLYAKAEKIADRVKFRIRNILYCPTFRGSPGSVFTLFKDSNFPFEMINAKLAEAGVALHIKLHPVNKWCLLDLDRISSCSSIHIISEDADLYNDLAEYDAVVTDFSSVMFDAIFIDRPVFLITEGLESYLRNDRDELYLPFDVLGARSVHENWNDLFRALLEDDPETRNFNNVRKHFYSEFDSESSERVYVEACRAFYMEGLS
jgi:CDP-glycerol glycerophosphotransferase (TagB/SpsB family)